MRKGEGHAPNEARMESGRGVREGSQEAEHGKPRGQGRRDRF